MKVKYGYEIRTKGTDKYLEKAYVREDARTIKNEWKDSGFDVKIIQCKYILQQQREVR